MNKKNTLLILANAFVSKKSIGGRDHFIIETTPQLAQRATTAVTTSKIGLGHWKQKCPPNFKFKVHVPNRFDGSDNHFRSTLTLTRQHNKRITEII